MKIDAAFFGFIIFLSGCAPSHSIWLEGMDSLEGTRLAQHYWPPLCKVECSVRLWSPASRNKNEFDMVKPEGVNYRYFVTWLPGCQYSVLVDPNDIILSWRYEVATDDKCVVW